MFFFFNICINLAEGSAGACLELVGKMCMRCPDLHINLLCLLELAKLGDVEGKHMSFLVVQKINRGLVMMFVVLLGLSCAAT